MMGTMSTPDCWYVAYGSNLDPRLLTRHLPGPAPESRWVWCGHPLWFGGRSNRWKAGVAFLGVRPGRPSRCRAYAVSHADLGRIYRSENQIDADLPRIAGLDVGQWRRGGFALSADGTRGKYDALLRLPDIAGRSAWTITTARRLRRRAPSAAYAGAIETALATDLGAEEAASYLRGRIGAVEGEPPSTTSSLRQAVFPVRHQASADASEAL